MTDPADTYEALRWLLDVGQRFIPDVDSPENRLRMAHLRELRDELKWEAGEGR